MPAECIAPLLMKGSGCSLIKARLRLVRWQMPPAPAQCCPASNQQLLRLPGLRWGCCTGAGAGHRKGKMTAAGYWAGAVTSGRSLRISLLCCWCASFRPLLRGQPAPAAAWPEEWHAERPCTSAWTVRQLAPSSQPPRTTRALLSDGRCSGGGLGRRDIQWARQSCWSPSGAAISSVWGQLDAARPEERCAEETSRPAASEQIWSERPLHANAGRSQARMADALSQHGTPLLVSRCSAGVRRQARWHLPVCVVHSATGNMLQSPARCILAHPSWSHATAHALSASSLPVTLRPGSAPALARLSVDSRREMQLDAWWAGQGVVLSLSAVLLDQLVQGMYVGTHTLRMHGVPLRLQLLRAVSATYWQAPLLEPHLSSRRRSWGLDHPVWNRWLHFLSSD